MELDSNRENRVKLETREKLVHSLAKIGPEKKLTRKMRKN
jgi:hypothetical protein